MPTMTLEHGFLRSAHDENLTNSNNGQLVSSLVVLHYCSYCNYFTFGIKRYSNWNRITWTISLLQCTNINTVPEYQTHNKYKPYSLSLSVLTAIFQVNLDQPIPSRFSSPHLFKNLELLNIPFGISGTGFFNALPVAQPTELKTQRNSKQCHTSQIKSSTGVILIWSTTGLLTTRLLREEALLPLCRLLDLTPVLLNASCSDIFHPMTVKFDRWPWPRRST